MSGRPSYLSKDRMLLPITTSFWKSTVPSTLWCTLTANVLTYLVMGIVIWLAVMLIVYIFGLVLPPKLKGALAILLTIFTWLSLFGISATMYKDCMEYT